MKAKILPADYYAGTDVVDLSRDLLGKSILTRFEDEICTAKIVETEAYKAPEDRACHAYNNRRTSRTETMFAQGGVAYVYLCYGIHHLFNIVTGPRDMAHAVLIRAVEPEENSELMLRRRKRETLRRLTAGPGILSVALGITTAHDGVTLYEKGSPINIIDRGIRYKEEDIVISTRIGVDSAGECAFRPWRFYVKQSNFISKR